MKNLINFGGLALLLAGVVFTVIVSQLPQTIAQHASYRNTTCPSGYIYSTYYQGCLPISPCNVANRGNQDYCGKALINLGAKNTDPNKIYDCSYGTVYSSRSCTYGCYISKNAGDNCNPKPPQNNCASGNKSYYECEKGNADFCTQVAGLRPHQVGHVMYNACTHQWSCTYAGKC